MINLTVIVVLILIVHTVDATSSVCASCTDCMAANEERCCNGNICKGDEQSCIASCGGGVCSAETVTVYYTNIHIPLTMYMCTIDPCHNYNCNHGTCNVVQGQATCTCNSGYSGQTCTQNPCDNVNCNDGTCNVDQGIARCTCNPGFSGQRCTQRPHYVGCFGSVYSSPKSLYDNRNMDNDKCIIFCSKYGYKYAATRGGNRCSCIDTYDPSKRIWMSRCYTKCAGNNARKCGGEGAKSTLWLIQGDPCNINERSQCNNINSEDSDCDCDYDRRNRGCKIVKAAPPGKVCKCVKYLPRSCKGVIHDCKLFTGLSLPNAVYCLHPDITKGACMFGRGNCGGY